MRWRDGANRLKDKGGMNKNRCEKYNKGGGLNNYREKEGNRVEKRKTEGLQ